MAAEVSQGEEKVKRVIFKAIKDTDDFKNFRRSFAKHTHVVGPKNKVWKFYDTGPKAGIPVICVPGTSVTCESFFNQCMSLNVRGYRLIAITFPPCETPEEWCINMIDFLDYLEQKSAHFFGTSLGGYLVLTMIKLHPSYVKSAMLNNCFCDTSPFHARMPWMGLKQLRFMPDFYLRRYILSNFPQEDLEIAQALAVDFVVEMMNNLKQKDLVSRLRLNCEKRCIRDTEDYDQSKITVIDVFDRIALPNRMRDQVQELLPNAEYCHVKTGGDFPYLANAHEFSMLMQVHLRKHEPSVEKMYAAEETVNDIIIEEIKFDIVKNDPAKPVLNDAKEPEISEKKESSEEEIEPNDTEIKGDIADPLAGIDVGTSEDEP